ncbi:PAC2 family protein [Gordonia sp. (in: high G+C Gram-positive bacteria)]|uniref:PAC2 family protein n=1 Tax=Gordonia sp. (in: high G+C Gram-positive bacteria) TaxID=84139 RepID=UPI0016B06914|nr:PAC2 family protein [Gordonia sp. (in: high G+C Gram-positive bacteria)]NLG47055.1 PAC2 family protein [Gordonia sp. (in: high G+C Gram-positive bacteria)]
MNSGDERSAAERQESSRRAALPQLRHPILLAAFSGWNDGAEAATSAVEHLALSWDATAVWEIDPDEFYDYQATRPTIRQKEGVTRRIEWPVTSVSTCVLSGHDRDVILVLGPEPNYRWRTFCSQLVDFAEAANVEMTVMLGALLADTPHTRPVPVSGTADTAEAAKRLGLELSRYEGPTGITGVLSDAFVQAGIPSVSLWAAVPHYVAHTANPKATLALLTNLGTVTELPIPLGDLAQRADEWEEVISEMTMDDEDMAAYVHELEHASDEDLNDVMLRIDGEELAAEFENYLRKRGDSPD